jgi:hypothetical protein
MKTHLLSASALILSAVVAAPAIAKAPVAQAAKAPIALTEAQMDKVVAGAPPHLVTNGGGQADENSCNSGQCYYVNSNGKEIGKPVKGYNN